MGYETLAVHLLSAAISSAIPLLLAALGGIVAERSGVLYIGLEGVMSVGAAASFLAALNTGSPWLGLTASIAIGLLFGLMIATLTISLRVDQVLLGVALIILGAPLGSYFVSEATGGRFLIVEYFKPISISLFDQFPEIGMILGQNVLGYVSLLLVPAMWFVLFRTNIGLKIRAVGEDPRSADCMGVRVWAVRLGAVIVGSVLASVGGAYVIIGHTGSWTDNPISGRGILAIAILRVGNWKPHWALVAALIFGLAEAAQFTFQVIPTGLPPQLPQSIPYILGIITLILASKFRRWFGPRSLALPYKRQ